MHHCVFNYFKFSSLCLSHLPVMCISAHSKPPWCTSASVKIKYYISIRMFARIHAWITVRSAILYLYNQLHSYGMLEKWTMVEGSLGTEYEPQKIYILWESGNISFPNIDVSNLVLSILHVSLFSNQYNQ